MNLLTRPAPPMRHTFRDEDDPGSLGEYRSLMSREFGAEIKRGGKPPVDSLADALLGGLAMRTSDDPNARREIGVAMTRSLCGYSTELGGFNVPRGLADGFLSDIIGVTRTMSELSGGQGGFAVKPEWREDILDRARLTLWPGNLGVDWWPVRTRTAIIPMDGALSGSSTFSATWGTSELILPPASDTVLAQQELELSRLIVYTRVSRDLLSDSRSIARWLAYRARVAIRDAIQTALVTGPTTTTGMPVPAGVFSAPSTVNVARATTNQIAAKDVDALWQAINPACRQNVVFHASESAIDYLDSIDASGQFPRDTYFGMGTTANYGLPYALLKGRPLVPLSTCPALGTPGDIFAVDWTQYVIAYFDAWKTSESFLSFDVFPADNFHRGTEGLPAASVESRGTEHFSFQTDIVDIVFKMRAMGAFVWAKTVTGSNGAVTGPAAVLS